MGRCIGLQDVRERAEYIGIGRVVGNISGHRVCHRSSYHWRPFGCGRTEMGDARLLLVAAVDGETVRTGCTPTDVRWGHRGWQVEPVPVLQGYVWHPTF
jgi:hypothetical protein